MIDGIRVLEEIHVTGDPSSIVAGLFCFLIFLLLVYVFGKEVNRKIERIKRSDDEGWNNILKKEKEEKERKQYEELKRKFG